MSAVNLPGRSIALDSEKSVDALIERAARTRVVFLGEASHGTEDFYAWRRYISERLIRELGFGFIAVEGDWPDSQLIHRYVTLGQGVNAQDVLSRFQRWPTWLWANTEIIRLAEWLRWHNDDLPIDERIGFYGLDLYSLFESIEAVVKFAEGLNPFLARALKTRYSCFDPYHRDEIAFARSTLKYPEGCERQAVENLAELLKIRVDASRKADLFDAQQQARVISNAERYYRSILHGDAASWNIRDRHMLDTLDLLLRRRPDLKGIVWAHNTHVGDYRATNMLTAGMVNLGGLARQHFGDNAVLLVGFGSYKGTVLASHSWDGPVERMRVPPARQGSYESWFHDLCRESRLERFLLLMGKHEHEGNLAEERGHRAIGVVYSPLHERLGNYVPTRLARRYDAYIHLDETVALQALALAAEEHKLPETWPSGI